MSRLGPLEAGPDAGVAFVAEHLSHLTCDDPQASPRFRGGQSAADAALAAFDVAGYASRRNEVLPPAGRGASGLSPYIRHGLLSLRNVWDAVGAGPARDVAKFRDELLWQEFARHWYALHGRGTSRGTRRELAVRAGRAGEAWNRSMACIDVVLDELETDGWLVNQTRMWLASDWAVRHGATWRDGEDHFFRHLLDGSRAANRLGWQWTTGVGSSKPYGFSRWQVTKRAPSLCDRCELQAACPIEDWPDDPDFVTVPKSACEGDDPSAVIGPQSVSQTGEPEIVVLTAESLGADDPALQSNPDLPVVFVFDEPLLRRLQLSTKRLIFLTETLAELTAGRDVEVHLGRPAEVLADRSFAVTFAPVPGMRRLLAARSTDAVEVHPWRWLAPPTARSLSRLSSYSAWRKAVTVQS